MCTPLQVRHRWRGMCSYAGKEKQGKAMCQRPNGNWAWEASPADYNPGFICGTAGQAKQETSSKENNVVVVGGMVVVGGVVLAVAGLLLCRCKQSSGGWASLSAYTDDQELGELGAQKFEACVELLREREQRTGQAFVCDDNHQELRIDRASKLGEGAFAVVHKGHWAPVGDVAVKVLTLRIGTDLIDAQAIRDEMMEEATLCRARPD